MLSYTIDLTPFIKLTDDQFFELCQRHPDLKFERNPKGEIIIVPPTGGETGNRNFEIIGQFWAWNRQTWGYVSILPLGSSSQLAVNVLPMWHGFVKTVGML